MAQIGTLNSFTALSKVDALDLNYNYNEIASKFNEHENATTDVHGIVSPNYIVGKGSVDTLVDKYFPIGSLRYVWDNNNSEIQALVNSSCFIEMDGTLVEDNDSIYNQKQLPDMSNIFIVGTTSDYSSITGSNEYSFEHTHSSFDNASHSVVSHNHTFSHSHALGNSGYAIFSSDATVFVGGDRNSFLFGGGFSSLSNYVRLNSGDTGTTRTFDEGKRVPLLGYTAYTDNQMDNQTSITSTTSTSKSVGTSNLEMSINNMLRRVKRRCFLRYK